MLECPFKHPPSRNICQIFTIPFLDARLPLLEENKKQRWSQKIYSSSVYQLPIQRGNLYIRARKYLRIINHGKEINQGNKSRGLIFSREWISYFQTPLTLSTSLLHPTLYTSSPLSTRTAPLCTARTGVDKDIMMTGTPSTMQCPPVHLAWWQGDRL